ncbi:MAG: type II toxin-antitoxin system PemK/MazF family toxin [Pseudomonadota bacterium]
MNYVPEQGDIVWLDFDPSSGREIMKRRPVLVISKKAFNQHTNMAIVAPITSTIRGVKLEVVLPDEMETKGSVLLYQLKSIDFAQRKIVFIEKTPSKIITQVTTIAQLLVQ